MCLTSRLSIQYAESVSYAPLQMGALTMDLIDLETKRTEHRAQVGWGPGMNQGSGAGRGGKDQEGLVTLLSLRRTALQL